MEAFGVPDATLKKVIEKDLGYIDILNPRSSEKVNFSTVRKYPKFLSSYRNNC